jgi:hypothetical protein
VTDQQLLRLAAAAAILGGALRVGTAFLVWNPEAAWLEALALVIDLSCLFGLFGLYLPHREPLGRAGAVAFVISASGIASIVGPDTTAFGIDTYQAGVTTVSLGLSLLSALMLRRRSGSAAAAWLWMASTIAGLLGFVTGRPETGFFIGGVLFGLAFVADGVAAMRHSVGRSPGYGRSWTGKSVSRRLIRAPIAAPVAAPIPPPIPPNTTRMSR